MEASVIPIYQKQIKPVNIIKRVPWNAVVMSIIYIIIYYKINPASSIYSGLQFDTEKLREIYRWWTYSLLHSSNSHLYMNMVMLYICGGFLEFDSGVWRTFIIYNLSILGGACGCGWSHRFVYKEDIFLVGASGGIYGLLAAQTGNLIMNWKEFNIISRSANTSLLGMSVISDIVVNSINPNPDISYSTHVGGFITGVLASICFVKNIKVIKWENKLKIASGVLLGSFLTVGIINLVI